MRRPHNPRATVPERRSAFDAMLVSESGGVKEGERLSVTERRAMTLQASRTPNADSQTVMKRWSDTDNLFATASTGEEEKRAKSALAMLGKETDIAAATAVRSGTAGGKRVRRRWRKQENVSTNSRPVSSLSQGSCNSNLDTETVGEDVQQNLRNQGVEHTHSVASDARANPTSTVDVEYSSSQLVDQKLGTPAELVENMETQSASVIAVSNMHTATTTHLYFAYHLLRHLCSTQFLVMGLVH